MLPPFRRVASFWNWLPAFRAVAEWQGVIHAARVLRTSPSALSRSIRLLESAVGETLFHRDKRSLVLTSAGEELLVATRFSMRNIDDVTAGDLGAKGPLRIASTSQVGGVRIVRALSEWQRNRPDIVTTVASVPHQDVAQSLTGGTIDVALTHGRIEHPDLVSTPLAAAENAVFCGRAHPLWDGPASATEVLRHEFVAVVSATMGVRATGDTNRFDGDSDGWPDDLPRVVALRTNMVDIAMDACVHGAYLAVLPVERVAVLSDAGLLRRLRSVQIAHTRLFAVRRRRASKRLNVGDGFLAVLKKSSTEGAKNR